MIPVQIKITEKKNLKINWDDDSESLIEIKKLRRFCPCATCVSEREEQGKYYIPLISEEQTIIKNIEQVGNYAIGITWKDGHNTGIYEYGFLRKLSEE
ncbi:MAG: DUF971 domain-containing protein [Ignavibacteriaceae bacterium]|jgi:DUF971 family protein